MKLISIALKYCNSAYAKGGKCDNTTSWAMDATDFQKITGSTLSSSSCFNSFSNRRKRACWSNRNNIFG